MAAGRLLPQGRRSCAVRPAKTPPVSPAPQSGGRCLRSPRDSSCIRRASAGNGRNSEKLPCRRQADRQGSPGLIIPMSALFDRPSRFSESHDRHSLPPAGSCVCRRRDGSRTLQMSRNQSPAVADTNMAARESRRFGCPRTSGACRVEPASALGSVCRSKRLQTLIAQDISALRKPARRG